MRSLRLTLTVFSLAIAFLLTACGSTASNPTPTPTTEARPTRTPRPAATEAAPTTAAPTVASGATTQPPATTPATGGATERPPIASTDIDLTALGNVQIEMKLDGVIKSEGQADEPIKITFLEIHLQNGDRSLTLESDSADGRRTRIVYLDIDDQMYQYFEDGNDRNCLSISDTDPFSGNMLTPDALIGNLNDAMLVERSVQMNGFTTDRYSFNLTEQTLGYQGQAQGEIWVSSNPAVVVRHIGELTGSLTDTVLEDSGELLPGALGNLRWEYNVTRLANTTTITLPELCAQQQAASADIPLPPNISNQVQMGSLISFETTASAADMATFYRAEMVARGWQAGESTQYGDTYQLSFSKDSRTATVNISTANNKTMVIILLEP
ncbi:hypothetical protein [Chloroflexus sp.]|uniref:hypothetical protein n=1 Tax=Chloroflexus sp. TaxID=1904827 RepID=UPI002611DBDA|nr:hypothetical protein [uncultured Chloroflexus sp.]